MPPMSRKTSESVFHLGQNHFCAFAESIRVFTTHAPFIYTLSMVALCYMTRHSSLRDKNICFLALSIKLGSPSSPSCSLFYINISRIFNTLTFMLLLYYIPSLQIIFILKYPFFLFYKVLYDYQNIKKVMPHSSQIVNTFHCAHTGTYCNTAREFFYLNLYSIKG